MNKNDQLPNFLIVGMAKCGTSSLSKYLQQHPEVFISRQKEPRFITSQFMDFPLNGPKDDQVEAWYVKNYEQYAQLFKDATQKAIGEASADTLYFHQGSIPVIKQYFGDPKIIIILRNPVNRAFSAYQHLVRDQREPLSFEEALAREPERIKNNWELIYHYQAVSHYTEPVRAFKENFSQVKVIFNEDLQRTPNAVLQEVLQFLGVDDSFNFDDSLRHNVSGKPRNQLLHQILWSENAIRAAVRPLVKLVLPTKAMRQKLHSKIMANNLERQHIDENTRQKLKTLFTPDVRALEKLLDCDLSKKFF